MRDIIWSIKANKTVSTFKNLIASDGGRSKALQYIRGKNIIETATYSECGPKEVANATM